MERDEPGWIDPPGLVAANRGRSPDVNGSNLKKLNTYWHMPCEDERGAETASRSAREGGKYVMDRMDIQQGADVFSADNERLGTASGTGGQYLVIEKGFILPNDYYVPASAIASNTGDTISLSVTKAELLRSGWDQTGAETSTRGAGMRDEGAVTGTIGATFDTVGGVDLGATQTGETQRIPVHEEELTATKRSTEKGQVRVDKDVVAEERAFEVPVTEERVRVTRREVDRPGTAGETAFEEGVIEVPLRGEEVDVEKRVHVAEEVEVAKETVQGTKRIGDTVRREEVYIEDQAGAPDIAEDTNPSS